MKHLLLLIPSDSYRAAEFLAAAESLNANVIVACDRHQTLEQSVPGKRLTLDFLDLAGSTARVIRFAKDYPITAIIPTDEGAVLLAVTLAESLSLPHNRPSAVIPTRDKAVLRERLSAANLPTPAFQVFSTTQSPEAISKEIKYPVVLKPTFLSGSQGVIRANGRAEFVTAFQQIQKLFKDPEVIRKKGGEASEILVETYVPGVEVAFEGILREGRLFCLALFDKPDPLEGPFFEETIYVTPSRLSDAKQGEIRNCVARGAEAIGLKTGPIHAELRINGTSLSLIEIAARSIGGRCAKVLRFGTGASLEEIIIRDALGLPVPSLKRQAGAAGVMMIPIPKAGTLRAIDGIDAANRVKGISGVDITAHIGQEIAPPPSGNHYLGFIFAAGDRPETVESALRKAHKKLTFKILPAIDHLSENPLIFRIVDAKDERRDAAFE